ncbi:MAG: hypothetical protein CMP76_14185 [Flavobacterium sp.]|uniref:hypothetical protein n=1 Tax=Flavobacterium sp. TaxID=239 RepID=UPI000C664863|nr:hypothetical protein [Flavobacterium sp.]MBF04431.1 hypothetical protein [Flavobacterium sp.]
MKTKILLLLALSFSVFSCKTVKTGTSKSIDIKGVGVIHKPVIVDLDVKEEKISKTIIVKNMLSLESAKNDVVMELLNENNADILVEPKFISKTKNGKTELTVTGWLGYYKNFRTLEQNEIELVKVKSVEDNKVQINQTNSEKK